MFVVGIECGRLCMLHSFLDKSVNLIRLFNFIFMADTPFSFLVSRTKWRKLWLVLKEIVLSASFRAGKLSGFGKLDLMSTQSANKAKLNGEMNHAVAGKFPETTAKKYSWVYQARVPVSTDILSQSAVKYHQDQYVDGGEILTNHTYQLSELSNASICSNGATHVSIYGSDDWCLPEYSYVKYGRNRPKARNKQRHLPIDRLVSGLSLNLYGNVENTAGNYGHWMVDGVGLLYLALREYSIDEIDCFVVPVLRYDFQKESLIAMGIPENKIIELPALSCFRFERLICASAPRGQSSCVTPGWLIDGYRDALLPVIIPPKSKRYYISRRDANSRKFENEDAIVDIMEEAGFEIVELSQYGFLEKIELFATAEVLVGLTGAGMTSLMFCSKDTQVIEIFPTSFVTYFYASMAGHLGLDYRPLIFDNHTMLSSLNKYYGNLTLDPELLKKELKNLRA